MEKPRFPERPAAKRVGFLSMRPKARDVLWLAAVLVLLLGWFYHATTLQIGKAMAEQEMRLLNGEIERLRGELAEVKPEKVYP
jgi:hypothetical protein